MSKNITRMSINAKNVILFDFADIIISLIYQLFMRIAMMMTMMKNMKMWRYSRELRDMMIIQFQIMDGLEIILVNFKIIYWLVQQRNIHGARTSSILANFFSLWFLLVVWG